MANPPGNRRKGKGQGAKRSDCVSAGNITKFFVSNLPPGCTPWELSSFLGTYGEVTDSYVARKKEKSGNIFGFVSFKDVRDKTELERYLSNVKMGGFKLRINIAKFAMENVVFLARAALENHKVPKPTTIKAPCYEKAVRGPTWRGGFSFKDTVVNNLGLGSTEDLTTLVLELSPGTGAFKDFHGRVLVGRTESLESLVSLGKLFLSYPANPPSIHYLGGFSVLLAFCNDLDTQSFLDDSGLWKDWFQKLDMWHGQSLPFDRVAWLNVSGVPLHLAIEEVLTRIGNHFRMVIHTPCPDIEGRDLSVFRVGILVDNGDAIAGVLSLSWNQKLFKIWVSEVEADWVSDCLTASVDAGGSSGRDSSDDEQSELGSSDNDQAEEEEGEFNEGVEKPMHMHVDRPAAVVGLETSGKLQPGNTNSAPLEHSLGGPPVGLFGGGAQTNWFPFQSWIFQPTGPT
ncbi:putative RNA recognition motif domain, nucleotide-binding alpha-beta plait domain superfamily [Helianthus annuus]|nr:putative RNA recognition motif domain, nucleotide-binding alpha-beta plait domain superfamily [Helianthus annuus]